MKIVQINAVYGMGSTGKIVRDISNQLIEQGHKSYVMWATGCRIQADGGKVELIRVGNWIDHKLHALFYRLTGGQAMFSKLATKRACKKILDILPDVVHLHNLHSNYIHLQTLFDCLAKNDIPTLITTHDCWFFCGYCTYYKNHNECQRWLAGCEACPAVSKRLTKSVEKNLDLRRNLYSNMKHLAVNGVSQWTTEAVKKSILKTASHIECIYNWIDTDVYKPKENALDIRQRYGVSEGRKLILGVSQVWCKEKGLDSFIMLAEELVGTADIILVGEGRDVPERKNLRCIGFTSNVDELVELYSAADVLVNPSNAETFGLVTVEAMACGTPVVAYDNSGSSELVAKECGILVEDGDKEALLIAVKSMLDKDKKIFSTVCREHVCKHFEKEHQIQEYIDFYQKISLSEH